MAFDPPHRSDPLGSPPPEAWGPFVRLARVAGRPLERFLRIEAASGVLLLLSAAAALIWKNSRYGASYAALWHTPLGVKLGAWGFERSLEWVVNDGLMVIFFFVVGLEIRREIHHGELSEWRRAALPAGAALGGMLVPAVFYLAMAGQPVTREGWGTPMATDIAFALGILTLLGQRVPAALRVLLLALAVIDDLGAIIVIAVFYSSGLSVGGLSVAAGAIASIALMQRFGIRAKIAYVLPSVVLWAGVYATGIHPTLAGVIVGLLTPVRAWLGAEGFVAGVRHEIKHLRELPLETLSEHALADSVHQVDRVRREALSPAADLIETLHPWVAFFIMPVFALANAGVLLETGTLDADSLRVVSGIVLGLVLGKPAGVLVASFLLLRLGVARLPLGISSRHLLVLGAVAGVGFTMALFVAQLAFPPGALLGAAKLGVLTASGFAAVLALVLGRLLLPETSVAGCAKTADEAEASTLK
jgi:NhaA family Na+:H+ antiporter